MITLVSFVFGEYVRVSRDNGTIREYHGNRAEERFWNTLALWWFNNLKTPYYWEPVGFDYGNSDTGLIEVIWTRRLK